MREEAFTSTHKPITVGGQTQVTMGTTHISRLTDDQLIKEFLSGSYCLHGVRQACWEAAPRAVLDKLLVSSLLCVCFRVWAGGSMNSVMGSTSISTMR